jgi:hypothetical protein
MVERSREMMDHLKKIGVGKNPIIWVGHSKGGLFVKQMIVDGMYHLIRNLSVFFSHLCITSLNKSFMFSCYLYFIGIHAW